MTLEQIGNDMQNAVDNFCAAMSKYIDSLGTYQPDFELPWDRDISDELARNPGPYAKRSSLNQSKGWWRRTLDQIVGVTIHHTMSDSPHAFASYYIHKGGGRPSCCYSIWVTQTGEVLLCTPLEEATWHDETGHRNKHLCVGLAGKLHKYTPSDVQLRAAARVCAWAIKSDMLPGITSIGQIKGDMDRRQTACPGWLGVGEGAPSGYWKPRFYDFLRGALA
jgi:hypothetical protein